VATGVGRTHADSSGKSLDLVNLRAKRSKSVLALRERETAHNDEVLGNSGRLSPELIYCSTELLCGQVVAPNLVD
jgi:hypothetical protein